MTVESIVNQALDVIGYKRHLGSIWDGSAAARIALDAWGDTRDTLFTMLKPDWAVWDDPLVPSKTAPPWYDEQTPWTTEYPDLPWRYEYPAPEDCLVPLALKPRPTWTTVWRPRPMRWRTKAADGVYTLLGDDPAPILTCVHRVNTVDLWEADFTQAMVEILAKKFAQALAPGAVKEERGDGRDRR